jgi:hypothetical protein
MFVRQLVLVNVVNATHTNPVQLLAIAAAPFVMPANAGIQCLL